MGEHHRHDPVVPEHPIALGEDCVHLRLIVGSGQLIAAATKLLEPGWIRNGLIL